MHQGRPAWILELTAAATGNHRMGTLISQSRRSVGLPDFVVNMLGKHLDTRPDDNDALVFVGGDGAPLRRSNFSRRHWKPAVALADLPQDLRFHDLRHTCVAFLISLGMQQYDVMRNLG